MFWVGRKCHALDFSVTQIALCGVCFCYFKRFLKSGCWEVMCQEALTSVGSQKQASWNFRKWLESVMAATACPGFRILSPLIFKTKLLLISMFTRYKGEQSWLSRIHLDVGLSNPQGSLFLSILKGIGGGRRWGGGKETFKSWKLCAKQTQTSELLWNHWSSTGHRMEATEFEQWPKPSAAH